MSQAVDNPGHDEQVMQAALAWHAATSRGDCDWEAFTTWLEQDPAHQAAYADVALLEDRIEHHRPALQQSRLGQLASKPVIRGARRARPWLAAAMAAGVLGVALKLGWNQLPSARGSCWPRAATWW
jgi:transmembrane sensor